MTPEIRRVAQVAAEELLAPAGRIRLRLLAQDLLRLDRRRLGFALAAHAVASLGFTGRRARQGAAFSRLCTPPLAAPSSSGGVFHSCRRAATLVSENSRERAR